MCKNQFTLNLFTSFIIGVSNNFRTFAPEFRMHLIKSIGGCVHYNMLQVASTRRSLGAHDSPEEGG